MASLKQATVCCMAFPSTRSSLQVKQLQAVVLAGVFSEMVMGSRTSKEELAPRALIKYNEHAHHLMFALGIYTPEDVLSLPDQDLQQAHLENPAKPDYRYASTVCHGTALFVRPGA